MRGSFQMQFNAEDRGRAEAMLPAGPRMVAAIRALDYGIAAAGRESGIFRASFMRQS